jgi:hypothetical protein
MHRGKIAEGGGFGSGSKAECSRTIEIFASEGAYRFMSPVRRSRMICSWLMARHYVIT